jgi:hypothetical protein
MGKRARNSLHHFALRRVRFNDLTNDWAQLLCNPHARPTVNKRVAQILTISATASFGGS